MVAKITVENVEEMWNKATVPEEWRKGKMPKWTKRCEEAKCG